MSLEHGEITEQIVGAAFEVHSILGYGFLKRVYQRAMQVELNSRGVKSDLESKITVRFNGEVVGDYEADLLVEDRVIVELKVAKEYQSADEAQLLNELKATGIKVGLLINFGRTRSNSKGSSTDGPATERAFPAWRNLMNENAVGHG